jgi:ribosomal protein S18 acetylase RimI-like enzyme
MAQIEVRALRPEDASWVEDFIRQRWGAAEVVAHGMVYHPQHLPGFVARVGGQPVGLVTYHVQDAACEIVTLDSSRPGEGIGTALVAAVKRAAQEAGCRRLWLITTNDNLNALRFYQRRGFTLAAVHPNAAAEARRLKPEIPLIGEYGIPIRDELELEMEI